LTGCIARRSGRTRRSSGAGWTASIWAGRRIVNVEP
jgi:hypothetical protein